MGATQATTQNYGMELTALTVAALEGRLETLHLLLSRGAAVYGAAREQYVDALVHGNHKQHNFPTHAIGDLNKTTKLGLRSMDSRFSAAITVSSNKRHLVTTAQVSKRPATCSISRYWLWMSRATSHFCRAQL
jgi:hypothetical protein